MVVLFAVVLLGFWLYCLFDVITAEDHAVRNLPKIAWILLVALLGVIGGVLWLVAGRPRVADLGYPEYSWRIRPSRPPAPLGPDDDPDFLRSLERKQREEEDQEGS